MKLGKLLVLNPNISKFEKAEIEFHNYALLFEHLAKNNKNPEQQAKLNMQATISHTLSEICRELQTIQ